MSDTTQHEAPALAVSGLRVVGAPSGAAIVEEIDLTMARGEIVGIVGESGSGKTTLGLACLNHYRRGTQYAAGTIELGGVDLRQLTEQQVRKLRGTFVSYIPQSPATALNPALRVGTQLRECWPGKDGNGKVRIREVLEDVALPSDDLFLRRYPHELSGGQQQRIAIAMAFIGRPGLVVLDEPTTGLDVSTQKQVLETIRELSVQYRAAALYISHDMATVANLVNRVAVMYSGRIVELGPVSDTTQRPLHPYTSALVRAVPDLEGKRLMAGIPGGAPSPLRRPNGCAFAPRCQLAADECRLAPPPAEFVASRTVRCFRQGARALRVVPRNPALPKPAGAVPVLGVRGVSASYGRTQVLHDVSIDVPRGQCVALVGESGSGKTTLSQSLVGLHPSHTGEVLLDGKPLAAHSARRTPEERRRIQYVFQNPYDSLNPRRSVTQLILAQARVLLGRIDNPSQLVSSALQQVALRPDIAHRFPDQLSGGERQRVAIARALVANPDVLICDEITSALDVSVQAAIVELLQGLQQARGLALLFVTHNLALVRNIADSVTVLRQGRVAEQGEVSAIFGQATHSYTQALINDTPSFELEERAPSVWIAESTS
jgi:peptide/nickel transport system ATP-binding protein